MEGVKSSPNNPGRQAILLSPPTPPEVSPSPCTLPPTRSYVPYSFTFPSLPLFLSFPFCIFSDGTTHPRVRARAYPRPSFLRSTWNHGGLTFIVSDNLPAEKASGTLRGIRDRLSLSQFLAGQAEGGEKGRGQERPPSSTTTVKAPSRRGERKNRREPTTPRKSLFLIWDEDIEKGGNVGVRGEGLDLVSTSLLGERNLREPPIEHVSAVLRTLGILRRIYAGFRKKFSMRFRQHFVSLFAREERGGVERQGNLLGLLRDLRRPIAAVTTAHYHQSRHTITRAPAQSIQRQT